jgi:hypothetical protein
MIMLLFTFIDTFFFFGRPPEAPPAHCPHFCEARH